MSDEKKTPVSITFSVSDDREGGDYKVNIIMKGIPDHVAHFRKMMTCLTQEVAKLQPQMENALAENFRKKLLKSKKPKSS